MKHMVVNCADPVVEKVVEKFINRSNVGIKKYNTSLHSSNQSQLEFLTHLQEELMDAVNYIEKLKEFYEVSGKNKHNTNERTVR